MSRSKQHDSRKRARSLPRRSRRFVLERLETRRVLATYVLDSFQDTVDVKPGDGVAADEAGHASLRAAIMEANASQGADTVIVPAGLYQLSLRDGRGDAAGDLDITDDLSIIGEVAGKTTIDSSALRDRAIEVTSQVKVSVSRLTISGGSQNQGGAIVNRGSLTIEDTTISGNKATQGGGIYNVGELDISNTTIRDNHAARDGGGIRNAKGGTLTTSNIGSSGQDGVHGSVNVEVSDNFAGRDGGGISNQGTFSISNLGSSGEGVAVSGPLELVVALRGNEARRDGGGFHNSGNALVSNIGSSGLDGVRFATDKSDPFRADSFFDVHIEVNANISGRDGGGVYNRSGQLVVSNIGSSGEDGVRFASGDVGGGEFQVDSFFDITYQVSDNQSGGDGGGVYNRNGQLVLKAA